MAGSTLETADIRKYLLAELPVLLEESAEIRHTILRISKRSFADRDASDDRFERMFQELQRDRELAEKRWAENQQTIKKMQCESDERWQQNQQELQTMRRESDERWQQNQQKSEAMRRESEARWQQNQEELQAMRRDSNERFEGLMGEIKALHKQHTSTIGALGARWGIAAESSFRDGLKEILEQDFGVQVLNVTEYDDDGEVFGRPDQVELDIIVKNGTLIICEIKSSISRSEMYTFSRKVQFYEKRHQRKATKLLVISPMVEPRALTVAEELGITVCSYVGDVQL